MADGRHSLPWRSTRDPYAVVVSEVMLQQTQVERVLPYYRTWLARWPDFASLAAAAPADAIRAWAGLGYNRRAVYLHRLAVVVVERLGGVLPDSETVLRRLPGIGPYTASAVRSFARNEQVAVLDTNVGRALARNVHGAAGVRDLSADVLRATAEDLLPNQGTRDHNLAWMDLGATVCTSRAPACDACPLRAGCAWRKAGYPAGQARPSTGPKFEETARFARGRIVDGLRRAEALEASELTALLPAKHHSRLEDYLEALERDAVVVRRPDGAWSLPGSVQGNSSIASPKL